MQSGAIDLVQRYLDIEIAKSEFKRIRFFIIALLIGLAAMSINFFVVENTTDFFINPYSPTLVVLWFLLFLIYELIGYFLARRFLKAKEILPTSLKVGNVFIEALFPSLLLFVLIYIEESPIFLDSPLIFFYFILIAISALNLETVLGLTTGLVSAGGYFVITVWAINQFDPGHEAMNFPPILYSVRSLFMLITSLASIFVGVEIKSRIRKAYELVDKNNRLTTLFGQQVSQHIVDKLMTASEDKPEEREVSIMFLDIRGFSSLAENKSPEEVIQFQNDFFSPIIRIINNHHGITNQIMGDGLMATFGAPIKLANHQEEALEAGLEIIDKIRELNDRGVLPNIKIGIGLHCGNVVLGNIGNQLRKQYSVSGAPVIIAARLEQLNKEYDTQFLTSGYVHNVVGGEKFQFTRIGKVKVHNIHEEIEVFQVT